MNKPRILFSVPTRHHVEIALDELTGLKEDGYYCEQFPYAARDGNVSKSSRLWVIVQNAYNLVKVAYRFKPDIIYFNSRLEVLAGMRDFITISIFKSCYFRKVRFIIKSHGSDIDVLDRRDFLMGRMVMPFLKRNISAWLFLSGEEKTKVTEKGYFPADNIYVTKNIVRTEQFTSDKGFKGRYNIPEDHKILLFVGRLIRQKGILDVLDAFDKLRKNYKSVLIIVGDGSEMEEVKNIITERDLAEEVILTGFIPEQDVVDFYANSDILVFPTYFPEGFPMALFNSVAAGLCIVTTATRAATDFLTEPDNCLWVEPADSLNVYKALERLFMSESLRDCMKQNNLRKAPMFSKKEVSRELGSTIQLVMQK